MSYRPYISLCLVALTTLLSGCGDDAPSPDEVAKYSSQALGIPVLLWAQSDDVCVTRQLGALYKEFTKATKPRQAQLIQEFKRYSAIVIQVSENAGTVRGDTYELRLSQRTCRQWIEPNTPGAFDSSPTVERTYCDTDTTRTARTWRPLVTAAGQPVGTSIDKIAQPDGVAPVLYITPATAKDVGAAKVLETSDSKLFDSIKANPDAIESALLSKSIKLLQTKPNAAVSCGKLRTFDELL